MVTPRKPGPSPAMKRLAELIATTESWHEDAKCRGLDTGLFFPDRGGSNASEAKAVCRRCTVRPQCLDYAIQAVEVHGIWGGLSERERRRIRGALRLDGAA